MKAVLQTVKLASVASGYTSVLCVVSVRRPNVLCTGEYVPCKSHRGACPNYSTIVDQVAVHAGLRDLAARGRSPATSPVSPALIVSGACLTFCGCPAAGIRYPAHVLVIVLLPEQLEVRAGSDGRVRGSS
jgi:hypothetical protein